MNAHRIIRFARACSGHECAACACVLTLPWARGHGASQRPGTAMAPLLLCAVPGLEVHPAQHGPGARHALAAQQVCRAVQQRLCLVLYPHLVLLIIAVLHQPMHKVRPRETAPGSTPHQILLSIVVDSRTVLSRSIRKALLHLALLPIAALHIPTSKASRIASVLPVKLETAQSSWPAEPGAKTRDSGSWEKCISMLYVGWQILTTRRLKHSEIWLFRRQSSRASAGDASP